VRRLPIVVLALALAAVLFGMAAPAGAQDDEGDGAPPAGTSSDAKVLVAKVSGLLDPVLADFIERSVHAAEDDRALAVVLQMNSGGSVLETDRYIELAETVRDATVPVYTWIGPNGSQAKGRSAQLAMLTTQIGITDKSRIGDLGTIVVDDPDDPRFEDAGPRLFEDTVNDDEAVELGIAIDSDILGDFLLGLPGFQSEDGRPITQSVFTEPDVVHELFHTVASPPIAYLLFLVGMGLLVFELFTAGVGVAGVVGAGSLILGAYGLDVLPARWWAVGLLVVSMFGFAVDVQIGVPRFWTGVGVVTLIVGSFWLYDGVGLSWITLIVGIGGVCLGMISGMPAMVRTRFSTPTIGREWMVGEMGVAESEVAPEGVVRVRDARVVRVRDALWRARTNRATPIAAGGPIRVVEITGLILEVEPEEGAAKDYREGRSKR
jgi:membrane-bound serine protease (ClpP class)